MLRDSAGKPEEKQAETSALSELRSKLECKYSLPLVAEFLEHLRIFEEWRRMQRPSHQARDAMLKVATQCGVARKKEGQIRKAEDVAEDLEVRILNEGRTMLRDIAEMPAAAPSNPITAPISAGKPATLEELQAWLATCTEETFTDTPPLKRLKTAVDVCTLPPSVTRLFGVQKLCGPQEWNVTQNGRRQTDGSAAETSSGGKASTMTASGVCASGDTGSAVKPATVVETSSGKAVTMSDGVSPSIDTSSAVKPAAVAETSSGKAATMSDSAASPNALNTAAKPTDMLTSSARDPCPESDGDPTSAAKPGKTEAEWHAKVSTKRRKRRAAETQTRSDIELAKESASNSIVAGTPIPAPAASNAASSAGKPDEKQGETSALSEFRSRLECMASNTHVEKLLQMLSALQEWRRNPHPSHQIRDAMLKAATKLGVKRKDRKAPDVGQDFEVKIVSRGIELMEQRKLPNLFKRLQASAVKPAVAEDDDDNIE